LSVVTTDLDVTQLHFKEIDRDVTKLPLKQ